MKSFRKCLSLILVFALLFALTSCGGDSKKADTADGSTAPVADGEVVLIKMGGTVPEDHPITKAQRDFEEKIEEISGGAMQVDLFPNGQLGTGRELMEAVQMGNLQMGETTMVTFSSFTDELMTLSLPFLFPSREIAYEFAETETAARLSEIVAEETGIRICGWFENGIRQLTNNVRPVKTPEDMKGMKIRVMESPIYLETFKILSANPMPMAFGELYTALQQGTVDGQDNPYAITVTNKFYEVQKYMTDLSHSFDFTALIVNEEFYSGLTEEQKAWFDEASAYATQKQHEYSMENEQDYIQTIDDAKCELTFLTDEERQVFRDTVEPVYDWFEGQYTPQVTLDEIQKVIEELS